MGAMPFAQHPAQKHREPACFCNGTFRAKSIAGMARSYNGFPARKCPLGTRGTRFPYTARAFR